MNEKYTSIKLDLLYEIVCVLITVVLQEFSSIPRSWKKLLHRDCEQRSTPQIIIEEMTCKRIYTKLLSLKQAPPPTCEKKLLTLGYRKDDLSKSYLLPFEVTKEEKLSMFQYKIIHNVLCKKSLLLKMKKDDSPHCPFCQVDHTIMHLSPNAHKLFCSGKSFWIGPRALWIQDYSSWKMK